MRSPKFRADRWDWRTYYDPDPKAPDKIYSKWGGFLPEVPFDPLRYGMPPSSLPSIEPAQLLALEVARTALEDAGYAQRPFPRERTAVVLGMGGGAAQVAMGYAFRSYLPMLDSVSPGAGTAAMEACSGLLPEWTEDSFPGFLLNVTAGRIANRLDLRGANYAVDAACGSSLAALSLAVRELTTGAADMVVLGGVDTVQNPFTYLAFSKTQAFSPRGRCRPFDAGADGIVISEGVAAVILKRLADAQRDGDRIYAVIQGVGASSDGRCRGLTAPSFEGQVRALAASVCSGRHRPGDSRLYRSPWHGHGRRRRRRNRGPDPALPAGRRGPGRCVVGSVKSQIGHTKCAAGLAGLIHASLALHHRVLPPTIGIETPNPNLDLQERAVPAQHRGPALASRGIDRPSPPSRGERLRLRRHEFPRRARGLRERSGRATGIGDPGLAGRAARVECPRPVRLASGAAAARRAARQGCTSPSERPGPRLGDRVSTNRIGTDPGHRRHLARRPVRQAGNRPRAHHEPARTELVDPRGVFYAERPAFGRSKVAFLFPGQGSQSVGMLGELAVFFDDIRDAYEQFDEALSACGAEADRPVRLPSAGLRRPDATPPGARRCRRPRSPSRRSGRRASGSRVCSRGWD